MEVATAPIESLLWIFTPTGIVTALSLFGLLLSGLPGRLLPTLETTAGAHRRPGRGALAAEPRRERIVE